MPSLTVTITLCTCRAFRRFSKTFHRRELTCSRDESFWFFSWDAESRHTVLCIGGSSPPVSVLIPSWIHGFGQIPYTFWTSTFSLLNGDTVNKKGHLLRMLVLQTGALAVLNGWSTGVGSHSLLQEKTQGSNPGLPRCWQFFTVEPSGKPLLYIISCYVPNRAATWLHLTFWMAVFLADFSLLIYLIGENAPQIINTE